MSGENSPEPTDEELVARFQADPRGRTGRAAVECLLGRYAEGLYRWCSRFVANRERVEDLVQDTLLAALRGLPGFQSKASFRSWLFTIARNRCLNSYRDTRLVFVDEETLDEHPGEAVNPARAAEVTDDQERMRLLLECELDPVERRAMWLRCVEGVPVEAITRLLGITQASGARGVLQAARRKLRAAIEKEGEGDPHA